jgi:hypothetical protein
LGKSPYLADCPQQVFRVPQQIGGWRIVTIKLTKGHMWAVEIP